MKKMKRMLMIIAMSVLVMSPNAMAKENEPCEQFEFEEASNPLIGALLIPIRMGVSLLHLPKCLIHHFPVNEPEEE